MQGEFRADVSRDTFDPATAYVRVLMQQGRVALDADWNEQTSILLHELRALIADLLGPHAGFDDGFKIDEKHHAGTAAGATPFDFWIAPGNYYLGGMRCSNDRWRRFSSQFRSLATPAADADPVALEARSYLVYLDAWERHVTHLEDDRLRDVALGGPDTASRAEIVWRVRATEWAPARAATTAAARRKEAEQFIADNRPPLSAATMRCRAGRAAAEPRYTGSENRLYRVEIHRSGPAWDGRRDRQGKPAGNAASAATFKWSRANTSVALPIRLLSNNVVQVAAALPDNRTVRPGDWVEVVDERLIGRPGTLWQVDAVDADARTVALTRSNRREPPQLGEDDRRYHPLLRRWDHTAEGADPGDGAMLVTEGAGEDEASWIPLEDGIAVQFSGGKTYRAGDYWLIPARTAIADVLWPVERDDAGEIVHRDGRPVAAARPPHGVEHRYAPIGLVRFDRTGTLDRYEDLRRLVERLAR